VHCIPRLAENTTVEISALGYQAGLLGAAALVMENLTEGFFVQKTEVFKNKVENKVII